MQGAHTCWRGRRHRAIVVGVGQDPLHSGLDPPVVRDIDRLFALSSLEAHLHQRLNHGVDRVPARGTDALAAHGLANAASGLDLDRGRVVQALGP